MEPIERRRRGERCGLSLAVLCVFSGCFEGRTPPFTTDAWTTLDLGGVEVRALDLGCSAVSVTLAPEDDACLPSGGGATLKYGKASICNIGTGIGSRGVLRFAVATIPRAVRLRAVALELAYGARDEACRASCGSCDSIEGDGELALHYMRADWTEAHVTWAHRAYQDPVQGTLEWEAAGASGAGDVGPPVARVGHLARQGVRFDSQSNPEMIAELPRWRGDADHLAFQIRPSGTAVFIAAMKEQPGDGCPAPGYARPALRISYCP